MKSKQMPLARKKTIKASKPAVKRDTTKPVVKNRITEVVYQTARDLFDAGVLSKTTMREFDDLCLPKVPSYTPKQIRAIRDRCKASQSVMAAYLNISPSALQKWETGARKPDRVALKLLHIVDKKGLEALVV
jgi:putative transcriptional regulator